MKWLTEAGPVYPDLPKSDLERSALYSMPGVLYVVFDRNGEWLVSVDSAEAMAALPTRMPSGYLVRGLLIPPSDLDPRTAHKFFRPPASRQGSGTAQIGTLGLNLHIGPVARVSTIMRASKEPDMRTNNLNEAVRNLRSALEEAPMGEDAGKIRRVIGLAGESAEAAMRALERLSEVEKILSGIKDEAAKKAMDILTRGGDAVLQHVMSAKNKAETAATAAAVLNNP